MREAGVLSLVAAAAATAGGIVGWLVHGDVALTRAVAYGFWFAAAACLVLMVVAGRKLVWRRTSLPVVEGWVWVVAAFALTVAGAAIDVAGA